MSVQISDGKMWKMSADFLAVPSWLLCSLVKIRIFKGLSLGPLERSVWMMHPCIELTYRGGIMGMSMVALPFCHHRVVCMMLMYGGSVHTYIFSLQSEFWWLGKGGSIGVALFSKPLCYTDDLVITGDKACGHAPGSKVVCRLGPLYGAQILRIARNVPIFTLFLMPIKM